MASQSLYRKWRSQTFGDLVGQEPVIRTLKNALENGNPAHAYLFTGPRGTGKTTTARLLAKTLNCIQPVNGEPCNVCEQCREITAGNSFNVIEIDAASNRGIDSIRELREKVMVPPASGKYKVYVLDEAHMLTTEAFNALLKTLEEPPPYVIFIMATTDVHKMLPTVLSRCQRFDFKRFSTREIVQHVNFVAGQEGVKIESSATELIARAAAGGMRDALSLLDQAMAYSGHEISLAQVQTMLGVADPRAIQKLISHVAHVDSAAVLHLIHELSEAGADLRQINLQVGEYWRSLMLAKAGADVAIILDRTEDETREIGEMMQLFELEELIEFARIFAQNDLMQKNLGTPQLGLELAFLQSIEIHRRAQTGQFPAVSSMTTVAPVILAPTSTNASRSTVAPSSAIQSTTTSRQQLSPPPFRPSAANAEPTFGRDNLTESERIDLPVSQPDHSASQQPANENEPGQPLLTFQEVKDAWDSVKRRVRPKSSKTAAMLNSFSVVGVTGSQDMSDEVVILIQAAHTIHHDYVREGDHSKDVDWAFSTEFGRKCRVRLITPGQPVPAATSLIPAAVAAPLTTSFAPTVNSSPDYTASAAAPTTSQQSARREPLTSAPANPKPAEEHGRSVPTSTLVEETSAPERQSSRSVQSSPVAKKNIVRENGPTTSSTDSTGSPQPAPETTKEKVSRDPVIQEVVKTFGAKIVDIRQK